MHENSYTHNPLIHKDRRPQANASAWVRSFDCSHLAPLIVCRGPIRKETMDVMEEMGIAHYGILLSEKDSITYTYALAPELRKLTDPDRVHRVPDYSGATREERNQRINQIIAIAKENGYNSVFAGYGFMAEEEEFVRAIEEAGLTFVGPCSRTVRGAGRKDEAKRTASLAEVSVTPGTDNVTTLTLLAKAADKSALEALAGAHELAVDAGIFAEGTSLEDCAGALLEASYTKGIDIITTDEIIETVVAQVAKTWTDFGNNRVRLKAIGGGGGKGQRILAAPAEDDRPLDERVKEATDPIPAAVREVLGEVKATGVGDNKNMLIELNVEYTRHMEIQLVGNGDWCLALGARDCSLQMHEQKLLEVSNTVEDLGKEIAEAPNDIIATALQADLEILTKMEAESVRFGQAVGLDSVSTFECIVDRERHYFMEMNTRIQVEHRVTELCYALEFTNPDDPNDTFVTESLVEVMVLLAAHKERLPEPKRIPRKQASVEARLNATNACLAPHAGGIIHYWSDPLSDEIRDDQGISLKNPDTGNFMKYRLAGAYDSNIALLVTVGDSRAHSYETLSQVLRRTKLQGTDLATNLEFHYGLVNWFAARNVRAKATTRFVMPYLTLVGKLKDLCDKIDAHWAFGEIMRHRHEAVLAQGGEDAKKHAAACDLVMSRKRTLLLRPLEALLANPHVLSGWLSQHRGDFFMENGRVHWQANPTQLLADTYHYLNMDWREDAMPAEIIWDHDQALLDKALAFYARCEELLSPKDYTHLDELLRQETGPLDTEKWQQVREAHFGFSYGLELLALLPIIADEAGFYDLRVEDDLTIHIPDELTDAALQERMMKVLVPPPVSGADEIVAVSGGMFYPREAPDMDVFIKKGEHFEKGQPLYIVEVMKMFNKVAAPFSGTIDEILVEGDGVIVAKGQTLFKVTPDEKIEAPDPAALRKQRRVATAEFLKRCYS